MCVCDVCGKEYETYTKDIGEMFAPIHCPNKIRIDIYNKNVQSFVSFDVCEDCARKMIDHVIYEAEKHRRGFKMSDYHREAIGMKPLKGE